MNWWEGMFWALSIALAIGIFVVGDDEPFVVRVSIALFCALLWLPALILFLLLVLADEVARAFKGLRK